MPVTYGKNYILKAVLEAINHVTVKGDMIQIKDLNLNEDTGVISDTRDERRAHVILVATVVENDGAFSLSLTSNIMLASEMKALAEYLDIVFEYGIEINI